MRRLTAVMLLSLASVPAMGKDVEIVCTGCQAAFQSISEDLIATLDYKALGPAEATGLTGIGVGVVASYVPVDVEADWVTVTGQSFSELGLAGIQVTKGLPFGFDLGAFYSTVPDSNVDILGGEVRYALLKGSATSPALALRGSYMMVDGIDTFDLESTAVDLSLSKGITLVTPYIGVGYVMGESDPNGFGGLQKVDVEEAKVFLGARFSLLFLELTPEVGQIGDILTYSLRLGFSI
ncbi:MAG: hypothetical protein L0Y32_03820 [Nevskiales bacterium]|nr:hypothetical protein [Nevskiales bacterium]